MAGGRQGSGLRRTLDGGIVAASTERQLLDRFVADRDELAFAAIVARHGPMVVGVCRSVLADRSEVDDAFQATFLVLVRKAGSLRDGDHLGAWLHGVARRVALQARAEAARRRRREPLGVAVEPAAADSSLRAAERRELAALLHAELDRLSAPERAAVLLCDLEGCSHQEAADQLGWALGTVKTRVARGRERLRARLARRGVALPVGVALAGLIHESAAAAVVPPALLAGTVRVALALTTGRALGAGLASPPILSLTRGALRAMICTQLKAGALALAATAGTLAVPALIARQAPAPPPAQAVPGVPAAAAPQPVGAAPGPARLDGPMVPVGEDLQGAQVRLADLAVRSMAEHDHAGQPVDLEVRLRWHRRLLEAKTEAAVDQVGRIEAAADHLGRLERFAADRDGQIRIEAARSDRAAGAIDGPLWDRYWEETETVARAIAEAKRRLATVQAEAAGPAPQATAFGPSRQVGHLRARRFVKTLPADEPRQRAILAKLEQRLAMKFPNDTPLQDVFRSIAQATRDPAAGLPEGIPIYADPIELQDSDRTLGSTVSLDLEGVPLRTTLRLLLRRVSLTYIVEGGLVLIVDGREEDRGNPRNRWVAVPDEPADRATDEAIRRKLEEPISIPFPNDTPIDDVLNYLRHATQDEPGGLGRGIPIYADPQGLQDVDKTLASTVQVQLAAIPLRTTLHLILHQLGLTYVVEGGMIAIVPIEQAEPPARPQTAARPKP